MVEKPYRDSLGLLGSNSNKFTITGKIGRVEIVMLSPYSLSSSSWLLLSDCVGLSTSIWSKRFFLALPLTAILSTNRNLYKTTNVWCKHFLFIVVLGTSLPSSLLGKG